MCSKFSEDFPKKNFRRWSNLYIDYTDNEESLKWEIAKWCFGTSRKEIPILRNGKVVASGKWGRIHKAEIFPPIYWDVISDEIAQDFFETQRKILISSHQSMAILMDFVNVLIKCWILQFMMILYWRNIYQAILICLYMVLMYGVNHRQ